MTAGGAFVDGRVFTGRGYVEAFLVEEGRIAVVGSTTSVQRERPVGCPVHRLHGQLVIPGLIDPHLHLAEIVRAQRGVSLGQVRSIDALVARVERWAESHRSGPILGRGWDESRFAERRAPTRRDLDRAEGERPVVLYRVCGHAAAVNSAALEIVGATRTSPSVPGGRFGVGDDGTPDGLLYERALERVEPIVNSAPPPTASDLRSVTEEAASAGLTMVASVNSPPEEVAAVGALGEGPALPLRLRLYPPADRWHAGDSLPDLRLPGESRSIVRGLKVITDGSFGARTAWIDEPYADATGTSGMPVWPEQRLRELARAAADQQISLALHAIGDRALATVLRALDGAPRIPAPRIEHASLVPPSLLGPLTSFRGSVVAQPHFAATDRWIPERLGVDRARWAYAWRTLLSAGVQLAGSSDAPFDVFDPWQGMKAAVDGAPWRRRRAQPDPEGLSPEQAVAMYTLGGARALAEPGPHGLAVGGRADFVVVRAPDLASAVHRRGRDGLTTWCGGVPVAERRPVAATRARRR